MREWFRLASIATEEVECVERCDIVNKTQVVRVDYSRPPLLYGEEDCCQPWTQVFSGYFRKIYECKNVPKSSTFNEVHAHCDTCHQLDKCSAVGNPFALGKTQRAHSQWLGIEELDKNEL